MKLRTLSPSKNLQGKRVLVRVDWNVPLNGRLVPAESLKIERTLPTIRDLARRGAIVILLTHLGRPEKRDLEFSTSRLALMARKQHNLEIVFHPESVSVADERERLRGQLAAAQPGSLHLLENVRFETGEDENLPALGKAYAALGELFINDAFASCHRAHASVVGITKYLQSFAGQSLTAEVRALSQLLQTPKRPFVAVIGGLKVSTKLPVLRALGTICERVLIGGAMANTFLAAEGKSVGRSFVEETMLQEVKGLRGKLSVVLPEDVMVTHADKNEFPPRVAEISQIAKDDKIVDIGPRTMVAWAKELQAAKTILWNGPVGIAEIPAYGSGSRFIARVIAARAKGSSFSVAGGGDTLPIIVETHTAQLFDHVSTGGGALLEFLALKGKLPGLKPIIMNI